MTDLKKMTVAASGKHSNDRSEKNDCGCQR